MKCDDNGFIKGITMAFAEHAGITNVIGHCTDANSEGRHTIFWDR